MSRKVLVLGVDGMDPKLASYCLEKGLMPNLQKIIDAGSCREDLLLLGAMPTVTPPMWTTLATGAYAATHGITAFNNQHPTELGERTYALDSRMCKAEPLWNVTAEAGQKTLVWHWPGSAWPPTSDNPNLTVVDGTQPIAVNMGVGVVDWEKVFTADVKTEKVTFVPHTTTGNTGAGCIITNLDGVIEKEGEKEDDESIIGNIMSNGGNNHLIMTIEDTEIETLGKIKLDQISSPLSEPRNWADIPEGAKEFLIMTSEGLLRRPCLIVPNEMGIYDKVYVYKSKKDVEPLVILAANDEFEMLYDEVYVNDELKATTRLMKLLEIDAEGTYVKVWMGVAIDAMDASVWHPASLKEEIYKNVGPIPPISFASGSVKENVERLIMPSWDNYCQWQADVLNYLKDDYDVIFSHLHNVDGVGHSFWHFAKYRTSWNQDAEFYQKMLERTYIQTDNYLGNFISALDDGWTIIVTSDHGLISEENHPPGLGEGGTNATVMVDLGYTVLKRDENGNPIKEIDWEKTRAIASRGCHIYVNEIGRWSTGIVAPEEKYELEGQIISDLYNYRDPHTGKRVVALALRNKDAIVFGMNGPECGDIVYFMDEGYNIIHMDSMSTFEGYYHTSVAPIFVAAGPGIKKGFKTDRVIRQVDVAPTMAVLLGVRMPAQCEGAPVYQILE